jgi:hypothetical protein
MTTTAELSIPETITQGQLERLQTENQKLRDGQPTLYAVLRGCTVRAAIRVGWIVGVTEAEVADLPARTVAGWSVAIELAAAEASSPLDPTEQ